MEDQKQQADGIKYESLQVYEGAKFKTVLTRKHKDRKPWVPDNPAEVRSFIPGTIRKIFVKEGQSVTKGENLVILEAMKMMNELTAGITGKVKHVHVKVGNVVTKNQVLVELEAEKTTARKKKSKK